MSKLNAIELLNCVEIDKLLPIEISTLEFFTHAEPDALPNAPTICSSNLEEMTPPDRLAHWKAENERLKFEVDTKQLIPAEDVAREFSMMAKAVVMVLETLPDILERDCALTPVAVSRVQSVIDDLRDQVAQKVMDAEPEEDEPEED